MGRTYYGHSTTTAYPADVMVRGNKLKKLTHHFRHSPGFYIGPGAPEELARCILLDSFGFIECPDSPGVCQCESHWVEPSYQAFKTDVVSKLTPEEDWKLFQRDVINWVFDHLSQPEEDRIPVSSEVVASISSQP